MLTGSNQKVSDRSVEAYRFSTVDESVTGEEAKPNPFRYLRGTRQTRRVSCSREQESESQDEPTGCWVEEKGKSERRFVMKRIRVEPSGDITRRESGQTSRRS